jgi:hypothetical protein
MREFGEIVVNATHDCTIRFTDSLKRTQALLFSPEFLSDLSALVNLDLSSVGF